MNVIRHTLSINSFSHFSHWNRQNVISMRFSDAIIVCCLSGTVSCSRNSPHHTRCCSSGGSFNDSVTTEKSNTLLSIWKRNRNEGLDKVDSIWRHLPNLMRETCFKGSYLHFDCLFPILWIPIGFVEWILLNVQYIPRRGSCVDKKLFGVHLFNLGRKCLGCKGHCHFRWPLSGFAFRRHHRSLNPKQFSVCFYQ